ncbi:ArsR/SmtB family transcription factor [Oryzobacter telluris]|uniref:ArsR/SmtB family transcription factor n=1 Tax=Oryzobacter telluris TaxID=3149179 RepID=UPI00370D2CC7
MDVFAAIADPVRRDLLRALSRGSARVADLAAAHPISRPAVSKHLRVLGEAGLVEADDVGRERHYRLRPGPLEAVRALLDELGTPALRPPVVAGALDALDLEVRRVGRDRRSATATATTSTATSSTTHRPTEETA